MVKPIEAENGIGISGAGRNGKWELLFKEFQPHKMSRL